MKVLYYSFCFTQLFLLGQVFQVSGSASSAVTLYRNSSRWTFPSYSGNSSLNCNIQHLVNPQASPFSSVGQMADVDSINISSGSSYPKLSLKMAVEVSSTVVEVFIMVSNNGMQPAVNALVRADLSQGLIVDYGTLPKYSNITSDGRLKFNWTIVTLPVAASVNLSFNAEASKDILQEGVNYFDTYCTYKGSGTSEEYGPFAVQVGLRRVNTYKDNLMYKQGFTALSFFMLLILGVLLVILGFCIFNMIRRKRTISPQIIQVKTSLLKLRLSDDEAKKRDDTIHGYCSAAADESIVKILAMRDKTQMHREIDSLDVLSTIDVETNIERERNHVSELETFLLIQELRVKGKITKAQEDAVISNYKRKRSQMDKTQDDEYQRELKRLYKKIAAKNRAMLSQLHQKQEAERGKAKNSIQGVTNEVQAEVSEQLDQQHQKERDEETYRIKLKQAEKTEKLRKKFTVKKQMAVKKLHQELIIEIKEQGHLNSTDVNSLMKKHHKNQKKLEKLYDEEISRQRMVLEEKLARRKNLAHMSEVHEADEKCILQKMESQQVDLLEHLRQQNAVSDTEADKLIQEAKQQMLAIKDRFDKEKLRQEEELHKRLSDLKKQRLTEDAQKHKLNLNDFDKKHQATQTADVVADPIIYAEKRLKLLSEQLQSKNNLENDLDEKHAKDMISLHKEIEEEMENELQQAWTNLQKKLQLDGIILGSVNSLLNQHDEDLRTLKARQDENRQHQEDQFKEKLAKNRESWNQRKEAEKHEQQQLRDCEARISRKLNDSQIKLSDEDRDMILREHEEHKVKLENNLALNKLRQMQMMEEKLAQKRSQRLEELQQEQEKQRQQHPVDNNAEEPNEDSRKDEVELIKEQIKQKLSVFQEKILDWDDEMEKIQAEMVAERSLALLKQEEQLETMIAEIQIKKRKEIAKIERQQHKIWRLNASLAEELNEKGTLNKPECQAFLTQHLEQQEQLNRQIEDKKNQVDEKLQKELKQRSEGREKTKSEPLLPMKGADRWKKVVHMYKHKEDMENSRKQEEREKCQKLEKFERKRKRAFKKQELKLLRDLVNSGQISKKELNTLLLILHPDETDAGISDILDKIHDPSTMEKDGSTSQKTNTKKRKKKKSKKLNLVPESHDGTAEAHYMDDEGTVEAEMAQQPLPVRLPPLGNETKKY